MEMQQMFERLLAGQARLKEKMDAYHEKMMAMLDAHHERTMACFAQTEATDFRINPEKTEPNPEENKAVLER
jgi:hypothetical protein